VTSSGKRVLALDVGERRTGIALSDPSLSLAAPLQTVTLGLRALLIHLRELIAEHEVGLVVIGQPELLSGRRTVPSLLAEEIGARLRAQAGVEVLFWQETLTSWEAERILDGQSPDSADRERRAKGRRGRRGARRRPRRSAQGDVDQLAAALLLQEFLDARREGERGPRGDRDTGHDAGSGAGRDGRFGGPHGGGHTGAERHPQ